MKRVLQMATPATVLVAALAITASGAAAAPVTIDAYASGYYQNSGGTPSPGSTNIIEDSTRNTYFAFDLSGVSGTVTGARLTIFGNNGSFSLSAPGTVTYSIYDVTTNIAALTGHTAGPAAFTDLGSGTVFGSTSITATSTFGAMPQLEIDLSGGLSNFASALGGLLALGGGSNLTGNQGLLWISSFRNPAAQLTLDVNPVPLPAALPLFATVLGGSGLIAWRRRRKQLRAKA